MTGIFRNVFTWRKYEAIVALQPMATHSLEALTQNLLHHFNCVICQTHENENLHTHFI